MRIIPARAGFTYRRVNTKGQAQDHPRSRGVYSAALRNRSPSGGSSPLARGLPPTRSETPARKRIIPARAGFTGHQDSGPHDPEDHPRSRGVYVQVLFTLVRVRGSSPLARGLLVVLVIVESCGRIIPARAGFTRFRTGLPWAGRDHPRSRGVYNELALKYDAMQGSSPLARGLRPVR